MTSKNGRFYSADLEMNLFNAASLPVSLDVGGCIRKIASIFDGLASMPFFDTRQPRNFPFAILKMLFSGLSLRPARLKFTKVSPRSAT